MRRAYQTDSSDAEWACIEPNVPTPKAPRRPRVRPLREILNAIFYIGYAADVPGCEWSGGTSATIVNIGDLVLQNHFYSYAGYAAIPEPIYTMIRDCPGLGGDTTRDGLTTPHGSTPERPTRNYLITSASRRSQAST